MPDVDFSQMPALLGTNVRRVDLETGRPSKAQLDYDQILYGFTKRTVVNLQTKINTVQSQTDGNTAKITDNFYTLTAADGALAQRVTDVSTQVGANTASIQELAESVDGSAVRWQVQGTIDSASGGVYFSGVRDQTSGVTYDFTFVANSFRLFDPGLNGGNPTAVFNYASGVFTFNVPVRVLTGDIGQQQVSSAATARPNGRQQYGANNDANNWIDVCSVSMSGVAGAYAMVTGIISAGSYSTGGNLSGNRWRLYSDRSGDLSGQVSIAANQTNANGDQYNGYSYEPDLAYPVSAMLIPIDDASQSDTIRLQVQNRRFTGSGGTLFIGTRSALIVEMRKR